MENLVKEVTNRLGGLPTGIMQVAAQWRDNL